MLFETAKFKGKLLTRNVHSRSFKPAFLSAAVVFYDKIARFLIKTEDLQ